MIPGTHMSACNGVSSPIAMSTSPIGQTYTTRQTRTYNEVIPGGYVTQGFNQVQNIPMTTINNGGIMQGRVSQIKNATSLGNIVTATALTPKKQFYEPIAITERVLVQSEMPQQFGMTPRPVSPGAMYGGYGNSNTGCCSCFGNNGGPPGYGSGMGGGMCSNLCGGMGGGSCCGFGGPGGLCSCGNSGGMYGNSGCLGLDCCCPYGGLSGGPIGVGGVPTFRGGMPQPVIPSMNIVPQMNPAINPAFGMNGMNVGMYPSSMGLGMNQMGMGYNRSQGCCSFFDCCY